MSVCIEKRRKQWRLASRRYQERHPGRVLGKDKRYREANREKCRNACNSWRKNNKEYDAERQRKYYKVPRRAIGQRMSGAIRRSLREGKGGKSWQALVDYDLDQLVVHLESQFTEGMSWENMNEWHIDHLKPQSHFDFNSVDDPEFKECWALANLRPCWAKENMMKGNRYVGM